MSKKQEAKKETPWYQDGLKFKCTGCGDCCTGAPGYVWLNKQDIAQMAELLEMEVNTFEVSFVQSVGVRKSLVELDNYDCVFFDNETRKCRVYSARPRQCRTWPFWDSNLKSPEAWSAACDACPGSGEGKPYTVEEIQTQAGVVRV